MDECEREKRLTGRQHLMKDAPQYLQHDNHSILCLTHRGHDVMASAALITTRLLPSTFIHRAFLIPDHCMLT